MRMKMSYLLACALVVGCATLPPLPPVPLPTTTPAQLGKLVVVESMQSEATGVSTMVLNYTNDTEVALRDVRVECTLLDGFNRVVNSDNLAIESVAVGAEVTKTLRIRDVHSRAARAECAVSGAKPAALRAVAN